MAGLEVFPFETMGSDILRRLGKVIQLTPDEISAEPEVFEEEAARIEGNIQTM